MQEKSALNLLDDAFEKAVTVGIRVITSSYTFIAALIFVTVYLSHADFEHQETKQSLQDIMSCLSFLLFLMVQKSVSRYSLAIQIKLNELIASHEKASNDMVNIETKTEQELKEIASNFQEEKLNEGQDDVQNK